MSKDRKNSGSRRGSNKQRFVKLAPNITTTAICAQVEDQGRITLLAPMSEEEIADQGFSPSLPSGDTNIAKIMKKAIFKPPYYYGHVEGEQFRTLDDDIRECKPVFTADDGMRVYR